MLKSTLKTLKGKHLNSSTKPPLSYIRVIKYPIKYFSTKSKTEKENVLQ